MSQEISLFRNFGLTTPSSVTFSEPLNALVGAGYTSMAGNTYFNSLRLSDGLLIKEDIGHGGMYERTFLNGIHIYDICTKTLLCEYRYPMYQGVIYSRETAKLVAINLLIKLIVESAQRDQVLLNMNEVSSKIQEVVNKAFFGDQMQEIQKTLKQLSA